MPYYEHGNFRLYYEVSGDGFPLVLHHGFSQWGEDWREAGWTAALEARSLVVTLDMLGHGRSERPHEIDPYRIEQRAEALAGIMSAVGAFQFDVFGFSLGGRVAYATAALYPERVRGLIVGGMHAMAPSIDRTSLEKRACTVRAGRLAAVERAVGVRARSPASERRPANDPDALALTTDALLDWEGALEHLRPSSVPALLFAGELDPLHGWTKDTAGGIRNAEFVSLEGMGHARSFYRSDLALPHVLRFLDGLSKL